MPLELDFQGMDPEPAPLPPEDTRVGKKRSSAPPPSLAPSPAFLPDDPLEAPRLSPERPLLAREDAPPSPSRPPPRAPDVSSRAAPQGLFAGTGSTEITIGEAETEQNATEQNARSRRVTTAMPRRAAERLGEGLEAPVLSGASHPDSGSRGDLDQARRTLVDADAPRTREVEDIE
ncbi:MAG: hypothetical protein ACK5U8_05840, partial [Deltaproteobacteria bacterium]